MKRNLLCPRTKSFLIQKRNLLQLLKEIVKKEPNPVHPHPGPDLVTILPVKEYLSHQQENPDLVTILAKKDPDPNHLQDQRDPNLVRQASPDLVQEQREQRHSDVINSVLFTQALTYILTL